MAGDHHHCFVQWSISIIASSRRPGDLFQPKINRDIFPTCSVTLYITCKVFSFFDLDVHYFAYFNCQR